MLSTADDLGVRSLTRMFRALGDETRLRIVALLSHGELCVCHIESALDLNQSNASRQLGLLKAAGIVDSRRDGTWVYYSIVAQEDELVAAALDVLTKSFAARRAVRADLVTLRKSCGPKSCT